VTNLLCNFEISLGLLVVVAEALRVLHRGQQADTRCLSFSLFIGACALRTVQDSMEVRSRVLSPLDEGLFVDSGKVVELYAEGTVSHLGREALHSQSGLSG